MTAPGVAGRELSSPSPTGTRLGPMPAGTALCPHQCRPAMAITFTGLSRPDVPQGQIQLFPALHSPPGCSPRDPTALTSRCAPRDPIPAVPTVTPGPSIQLLPPRSQNSCSHCYPIQMCSLEPGLSQNSCSPPVHGQSPPHPIPSHVPPSPPSLPPSRGYFYPPFSSLLLRFHPASVTFTTSFIPTPDFQFSLPLAMSQCREGPTEVSVPPSP